MITTQHDDHHKNREKVMIYPAIIHVIRCRQIIMSVCKIKKKDIKKMFLYQTKN